MERYNPAPSTHIPTNYIFPSPFPKSQSKPAVILAVMVPYNQNKRRITHERSLHVQIQAVNGQISPIPSPGERAEQFQASSHHRFVV